MADKEVKIGTTSADSIMFADVNELPSDFQYDLRTWIVNDDANNDIEVSFNKIVIKKFKPNVWILKSPICATTEALCEESKNLAIGISGISSKLSTLFSKTYFHHSVVGASGGAVGYIKGVGVLPFSDNLTTWVTASTHYGAYGKNRGELPFSAYIWDSLTYSDGTTCQIASELNAFRGDWSGAGYNAYGKTKTVTSVKVIPDYSIFPAPYPFYRLSLGLYTGSAISFEAWECENRINALKMTISKRNADDGSTKSAQCSSGFGTIHIKVSGLSDGDRLEFGDGVIASSDNSITADGEYTITQGSLSTIYNHGFILYGNTSNTSPVTIELINNEYLDKDGYVDVSDSPITISLVNIKGIDPTSVECWDAYCGDTQLYHKDKTLENCWKKYGLAFPKGWRLVRTNFAASDYVEWVSPTRFRIKSVPSGGVTISVADDGSTSDSDNESNYVNINWKQFVVKLSQELPAGVTVKVVRGLGNAYYDYDNATGVYSNPVSDIETALSVGENTIAALNTEIHRKSSDATMSFNECRIVISSSAAVEDVDCYVEIVPPFADGEPLTVIESHWNLSKVKVPAITDLEEHIDNLTFNINPANADFWTPIKEYYADNVLATCGIQKFYSAQNLDELSLILPDKSYLWYNDFKFSSIKKLTLTGQKNTYITSLNGIFEGLGHLTELVVNVDDEHDGDYLAGANDCSNMFNDCGLPTYPSNFICWNAFRTNAAAFSKKATMAHSMFWHAAIETVPNYGTNADADANTILCGTASGMFYKCDDLVTVGPIVDLQLIKPTGGENIFVDCTKLTTIRIKNLNHGNWHFDNTEFESGKKHGTLEALDASSIQYLFSNLADLNNYDADKNVSTINNDFLKWSSAYTTHGVYSSDYDYKFASASSLVLKKRFASQPVASFIVSTTSSAIDISFTVYGLADGDSLLFGAGGSSAADYTITEDGTYTVKKTDTLTKGFMLVNSDTSVESDVTVTLNKGWDLSVPSVSTAELHCPAEWEENVTDDMVTAANAKGWSVYIGGTIKEVS